MPSSVPRRVSLSRPPRNGLFRQPSPLKRSASPAALTIDRNRCNVRSIVSSTTTSSSSSSIVGSIRPSTRSILWPASLTRGPRDFGMVMHNESSQLPRNTSWSSKIEASKPIDIPSPSGEHSPKYFHASMANGSDSEPGDGKEQEAEAPTSCWSAGWYPNEPWNRTTEFPDKTPAHLVTWENRARRSARVAAIEAAEETGRKSGGVLEDDSGSEYSSPEDISIFELDM